MYDVLRTPPSKWFAEVFRTLHFPVGMYQFGDHSVIETIAVSICMTSVGRGPDNFWLHDNGFCIICSVSYVSWHTFVSVSETKMQPIQRDVEMGHLCTLRCLRQSALPAFLKT